MAAIRSVHFMSSTASRLLGMAFLVLVAGIATVIVATTAAAGRPTYSAVDLGTLGGASTEPIAITAQGQVVGTSLASDGWWHGFVWSEQEGMVDLGTLGGDTSSVGSGFVQSSPVNKAGDVVGQSDTPDGQLHAFVWTKRNGMVALEAPPGTYDCVAFAINDAGQILGQCATDEGFRGVLWTK